MSRINSDDLVLGMLVGIFVSLLLKGLGNIILESIIDWIQKKIGTKISEIAMETLPVLSGLVLLYLVTCVKVSTFNPLASLLKLFSRGHSFINFYRVFLTSIGFMCYIFLCRSLLPRLLENIRFLFYRCIRKSPKTETFFLTNSISYAVLITPVIIIGLTHLVTNLKKYYDIKALLIPIRPYVLESFKAIKGTILVVPETNYVNLLGFSFYNVAEMVGMTLICLLVLIIIISVFSILYKLCALFTKNEENAGLLFGTIVFMPPIVALIIAILSNEVGIFIVGIFCIILFISFIVATIIRCLGEAVAYGVSSGLQAAGVSKSVSDVVGTVSGGIVAGAVLNTAANTVKDTINPQQGNQNHVNTYNPGTNPEMIHVDGYYRHDGTYVHGHQRTKPNNITGDNLSSK